MCTRNGGLEGASETDCERSFLRWRGVLAGLTAPVVGVNDCRARGSRENGRDWEVGRGRQGARMKRGEYHFGLPDPVIKPPNRYGAPPRRRGAGTGPS